ncbi:MAG: ribosome biogenesis GTPase Der [Planctomycetes bacterium GWF2_42_9]|nr:MAG: ribosome biogenesis GTPase Der [Planctomycetes bacterium GWF2_42_9]HAL45711.1 ribosome biogenesis GTPase Der [Phycisphaerales bacterium]
MAIPIVAIVGRPNVGKSSLFNAIAGEMISIVEPTAGVTRDRVSAIIERNERFFELIDTGGYGIVDSDQLKEHIENQIHLAIGSADLVLFVVDIRDGLVPLDEQIAQLLRKNNLKVMLVANKADESPMFPRAAEFGKLGFGDAFCVSAANSLNSQILVEKVIDFLKDTTSEKPQDIEMHLAIVGKRNAGKSTLTNAIAGSERVIVSELPGTTRDAIDVRFEKDGKTFVVIDTAGVRKKGSIADSIEFYSYVRATKSVSRADVVLFLIDASEPMSQVDKKLGAFIAEEHKACILVVNKWDLAMGKASTDDYVKYIGKMLPQMSYAPIAFTTASEGKNIQSVIDLSQELFKQAITKVSTPRLNKAIELITQERMGGKSKAGSLPKIYYATQVAVNPITIILFVNKTELFDENFRRYLVGKLRDFLGFAEVPIRLLVRPRRRKDIKDFKYSSRDSSLRSE